MVKGQSYLFVNSENDAKKHYASSGAALCKASRQLRGGDAGARIIRKYGMPGIITHMALIRKLWRWQFQEKLFNNIPEFIKKACFKEKLRILGDFLSTVNNFPETANDFFFEISL